jgi:SAM-dependent methyltransferase
MSYLGRHAECYDLFYKDKPYRAEAEYVTNLIELYCPGARTILDLGCGTGLRCLELARLGYKVSGLDQSLPMLALARQHLSIATDVPPGAVEFFAGDITKFKADYGYHAVVSLFHVFSYLTTEKSLQKAFACSFNNLRPGGVFLFDYWHGPGVLKDPPVTRTRCAENATLSVIRTSVPKQLSDSHLVELSLSLKITEKITNACELVEETYLLRYWFLEELERELKNSGFKDIGHYAWLTQSAPESETWQACTLAVKP